MNARSRLHQRFSANWYGWFRRLSDCLLALPANASILELGCGLLGSQTERISNGWSGQQENSLPQSIEKEISTRGAYHISKRTGLFIALKG